MIDILAISPPETYPEEAQSIVRLLDAGVTRYHLRKPSWTAAALDAFLRLLPPSYYARLVLHQHHALLQTHALGGWHAKDRSDPSQPLQLPSLSPQPDCNFTVCSNRSLGRQTVDGITQRARPTTHALASEATTFHSCIKGPGLARKPFLSRSLHRITALDADTQGWDAALLSPVFPSLSKPGHCPPWTEDELVCGLRKPRSARLYALGGIDATRAAYCIERGFDGIVLHGVLWQAADPVVALETIQRTLP